MANIHLSRHRIKNAVDNFRTFYPALTGVKAPIA